MEGGPEIQRLAKQERIEKPFKSAGVLKDEGVQTISKCPWDQRDTHRISQLTSSELGGNSYLTVGL